MPVIVLLNQKGGVGKTSTTHHLAGTLCRLRQTVLLVDNDPQASLTQGLLGPAATRALPADGTIAACYGGNPDLTDLVQRVNALDLVPGSRHAASFNVPDPHRLDYAQRHCLREVLHGAALPGGYDFVLIDCPPNLHLCSWAALVAADYVIVPVQAEDYGAQGLLDIRESIALVQKTDNPDLTLLGYLITMFQSRRAIHKMYEATLIEQYGGLVFSTRVPHAAEFPEAIAHRKSVADYKPRGATALMMQSLATEIRERINGQTGRLAS